MIDIFTSIQLYGTWLTDSIFILQIALSFFCCSPPCPENLPSRFSQVRRVSTHIGGFLFTPSLDNVSRSASLRPTPSLSVIQGRVPGSHRIHIYETSYKPTIFSYVTSPSWSVWRSWLDILLGLLLLPGSPAPETLPHLVLLPPLVPWLTLPSTRPPEFHLAAGKEE